MLDVEAILTEVRTTLEGYNAEAEEGTCGECSQLKQGRLPIIACVDDGCDVVAEQIAVALERVDDGKWKVRVVQNTQGLRQLEPGVWVCAAGFEARRTAEAKKIAADAAAEKAKTAEREAAEASAAVGG